MSWRSSVFFSLRKLISARKLPRSFEPHMHAMEVKAPKFQAGRESTFRLRCGPRGAALMGIVYIWNSVQSRMIWRSSAREWIAFVVFCPMLGLQQLD